MGAANGTALTAMIGGDQQIFHQSKPILETLLLHEILFILDHQELVM